MKLFFSVNVFSVPEIMTHEFWRHALLVNKEFQIIYYSINIFFYQTGHVYHPFSCTIIEKWVMKTIIYRQQENYQVLPSRNNIAITVRILRQLSLFSLGLNKYGSVISQSWMGAPLMEFYPFQLNYKPAVYCEGRKVFEHGWVHKAPRGIIQGHIYNHVETQWITK